MAPSLGEIVKQARTSQNWDQAELARRIGDVGQQTVSRWERGLSRPRRAMVGRLAELLRLDVRDLLVAAGYIAATADSPQEAQPPVQPRLTTLRLDELTPDRFEQFSADLAQALFPDASVHRYGGQGNTQGGIDVLIKDRTGTSIGIQCKREREFGPAKVNKAIKALTVDVETCFLFLTRIASPEAREEIAKHKNWKLWDIEDISRAVRTLPDRDAALRLVDTYFPQWREPFLGIEAPGPWLTSEQFFRPFSGDQVYTHDWDLVGRAAELDALKAHLMASDSAVGLVIGRGGIGKSRLLRALSTDVDDSKTATVRFLATGMPVDPAQYELLPPDNKLVVIIDDAHDRTDNAAILGGIRQARPNSKVLLSLRPQGLGQLTAELRYVGLHASELPSWTLDDLQIAEAEALAREILGKEANPAVVRRLAAIAPDCPLLIVVGATLIKRGKLDPNILESNESIRTEILARFRDAVVADPNSGDPELRRETLRSVAVLQPFRIGDPEFRSVISNLTGRAFDQVLPHLRGLESSGVLLRRGESLRVVPDLLGDVVLADAALDVPSGTSTGYLERVYQVASGQALQHVFINASRVDWQIRQSKSVGTPLVEFLWAQVSTEFQTAGISDRVALLGLLEKVAFFQPGRTLSLVRWAVENPTDEVEEIHHAFAALYQSNYGIVLKGLPSLLQAVGFSLEHLPAAADLLWDLARNDARPTHQYPNHPIRILSDLASFGIGKPTVFQDILIDAVQRWLTLENLNDWPYSPFEIVMSLLETEVEVRRSNGLSLTLQGVPVNVGAVRGLRERILNLAFEQVQSRDPKRAIAAAKAISESITFTTPRFGRHVSSEEREQWTPVFIETIERLGQLVTIEGSIDPAAMVILEQALRRHASHSPTITRDSAETVLSRFDNSPERKLAEILHDGWGHAVEYTGDVTEFERRRQNRIDEIVTVVTDRWSEEQLVDQIAERLNANRFAHGDTSSASAPFVWALTQSHPNIGEIICRRVIRDPTSILRELVPIALGRLLDSTPPAALAYAYELIGTDDTIVQRCVAQAVGWGRGNRIGVVDGEPDLLRTLLRSNDVHVRRFGLMAARTLSATQRSLALELVTSVRFEDSREVADEAAGAFYPGYLTWTELSQEQANAFIAQLLKCPRIDGFQTVMLLDAISKSDPQKVLNLLMGRVELFEKIQSRAEYEAIPRQWHRGLSFREAATFVDFLRSVIDWMTEGVASWYRLYEGAEIFTVVAQHFDEQVTETIIEAIEAGDKDKIKAVGAILGNAPENLVWDNVPFVTHALREASKYGEDCVQTIGGGFHSAVVTGARWGTPGQPFPEDIKQRDKAMQIAAQLPYGSIERRFYQSLQESAESRIRWEEKHDRDYEDGRHW